MSARYRNAHRRAKGGKEATLYLPSRGILGTSSKSVRVAQPRKKRVSTSEPCCTRARVTGYALKKEAAR